MLSECGALRGSLCEPFLRLLWVAKAAVAVMSSQRQRTEPKKEALKELADDSPSERTNLVSNGDREVESYQGNKLFSYESESSGATPRSVSPNRELVEGTTT